MDRRHFYCYGALFKSMLVLLLGLLTFFEPAFSWTTSSTITFRMHCLRPHQIGYTTMTTRRRNMCIKTKFTKENGGLPSLSSFSKCGNDDANNNKYSSLSDRKRFLNRAMKDLVSVLSVSATVTGTAVSFPSKSSAEELSTSELFTRKADGEKDKFKFGYEFKPPPDCKASNKPLKTHVDEINFICTATSGYQYGITVDPVRITSLAEFGTPEEVAAKVVLAELNRDGVFDVKLMEDPIAPKTGEEYYALNYRSSGKRGIKRYIAKFLIRNQTLYALTAQCKEDDFVKLETEMKQTVDSFHVVI